MIFPTIPRRFFVLFVTFLGPIFCFGFRSCFAMVMTHLLNLNSSRNGSDLYPDCIPIDSNPITHTGITEQMIFYSHAVFYTGSILSQIPVGMLTTRFSPRRVAAISMFVSCFGTFLLPLVIRGHVVALMIVRLFQGAIESSVYPPLYILIGAWTPQSEKTRAIAIFSVGGYASPALAMIFSGATVCYLSWDSIFHIYATLGVIWSLVVLFAFHDSPLDDPKLSSSERAMFFREGSKIKPSSQHLMRHIPWKSILTSLPVYTLLVAEFSKEWTFAVMQVQIQGYFEDMFGLNSASSGTLSGIPDLLTVTTGLLAGVIVDYVLKHNFLSTTVARKIAQSLGFGSEALCILALYFVSENQVMLAFGLLCFGVGMSGVAICGYEVNFIELAPQYTAVIAGLTRIGILGSVLCTLSSGLIIKGDNTAKGWQTYFLITGLLHLGGAVFYALFASGDIQPWALEESSEPIKCQEEQTDYGSVVGNGRGMADSREYHQRTKAFFPSRRQSK